MVRKKVALRGKIVRIVNDWTRKKKTIETEENGKEEKEEQQRHG